MDSERNLFIIAFFFISFIVWQTWKQEHSSRFSSSYQQELKTLQNRNFNKNKSFNNINNLITVITDKICLKINKCGGNIEHAYLLTYKDKLNSKNSFHLLETSKNFIYQAQSGILINNHLFNFSYNFQPNFLSNKKFYVLKKNQNTLCVPLIYSRNGIFYKKIFVLKRGNFAINVYHNIDNKSTMPIQLSIFGQLKQSIDIPKKKIYYENINFSLHTYRGAAYSSSENAYKKYSFKNIQEKDLNIFTENGWIAMLQQYFATAWVPFINGKNTFYTRNIHDRQVVIGFKSYPVIIFPKTCRSLYSILWIGPELQDKMSNIAPNLDLTVDYGWLWFISQPMFKLLKWIYGYVKNWGFSIIIITFIVRSVMYPLTKAQYVSMAKIKMLQPKLDLIRSRLENNQQKQNQEIIDLYKEEKVNPLGGCLPLIIQMPIFLALYYMLSCSIELRHANFIFWIRDLSGKDPYYILPILMGITMFFTQNNNSSDETQKKISFFMPFIFIIFFLWLPSGLVLYYIVSNLVTIIQQKYICKSLDNFKKLKK